MNSTKIAQNQKSLSSILTKGSIKHCHIVFFSSRGHSVMPHQNILSSSILAFVEIKVHFTACDGVKGSQSSRLDT